jgi:ABC-type Fe3+/spermidine/putrescine transport system ATPase subunit
MLLDEPLCAGFGCASIWGELIQKRTGVTFIYITHDQGEALAMSDRVGVMSQGKLQQVASPREIYNRPANGFVASFVGENNILTGKLLNASDGKASFATQSAFRCACRKDRSSLKLCPPRHTICCPMPEKNSVPVMVAIFAEAVYCRICKRKRHPSRQPNCAMRLNAVPAPG